MTQTPENQQQYGSILTILGENAEQNGKLQNKQITFTHMAIGDANDEYVQPDRKQTALVNELARIPVNSVDVLQPTPDSVPMLKVEAILPDDVNDLVIREFAAVATFDGNTYFHAVGNNARIYVPPPVNNGNVSTPVTLEMIFVITSADPIVEMDPNVVTASREYVDATATSITQEWLGLNVFPKKQGVPAKVGNIIPKDTEALRLQKNGEVKIYILDRHVPSDGVLELITENSVTISGEQYELYPQKVKLPTAKSFNLFVMNRLIENQVVETEGYYTPGDGGAAVYFMSASEPADGHGNLPAGDLTAVIISAPTDKNHGVLTSASLDPTIALNNRAAIEAMLRNRRFNYFELISNGDVHIIGSIHPLRSNIKIRHDKACNIKGYLSDPSSSVVSVGHIFGFPIYKDPDNNELEIVEQCVGVEYKLEGDIASIYRDSHVKPHNNNCIGFYNAKSCYVVGSGGVSESDHKGVTFDGDAVDCHIDIGYIKNTSNEPWQMKGNGTDERYTNTVRVGVIENPKFDGGNNHVVGFVSHCDLCIVRIGSYVGDKSLNPILVGAFDCNKVIVKETYCENVSQILRQYDTAHGEVFDVNYKNTDSVINRAGLQVDVHKTSSIKRVICKGGAATAAYHSEVTHSRFNRLIIRDNDFSAVSTPSNFELYKGQASASLPNNTNISGNETPLGYDATRHPNMSYGLSGNLISGTPHSFTYHVYDPDFRYTKMSLQLMSSSPDNLVRLQVETNLRSLVVSDKTYHLYVGPHIIECVNNNGLLTFTAPSGYNFSWVEASN